MNYLVPIAIAIGAFIVAPVFIVVPMSFSDSPSFAFPPTGYWLGYYKDYFTNESWTSPTINSTIIATVTMFVTMALVIPASFSVVRFRFMGRSLVNFLLMMPLMVPHIVLALAYYSFLGSIGLINSFTGVIIAHTCISVPVAFLIVSATLKGFDRSLERAAMSAGAGPLQTFFYVTLPVLRPGFLVASLFTFIHSFDETVIAIFIAGRDAHTLPKKMYESVRLDADPVLAVVSTLLFTLVMAGTVIAAVTRKGKAHAT